MSSASALLGIARYEMGDYAGARAPLEAALRANPKDDNAELFLANTFVKLGELDLAAEHLRKLSQRQPANQQVLYLLGKVHMKLSEEALARLNESDANSVWAHEISGEITEGMKNYDVAAEQLHAELANDPGNCMAQWKLGNIVLEQHANPEEAFANTEKALAICPNLMAARVDRARALMKLERHAEAVKDLEAAEKSDPAEASTHFLLAQTYRALGKTQEAQAEMKLFSKLEESSRAATAERAKQVLEEKNREQP